MIIAKHGVELVRLINEAKQSIQNRGHVIDDQWELYAHSYRLTAYIECVRCSKGVQVNTAPMPNQIDIGGEAVALGCKD